MTEEAAFKQGQRVIIKWLVGISSLAFLSLAIAGVIVADWRPYGGPAGRQPRGEPPAAVVVDYVPGVEVALEPPKVVPVPKVEGPKPRKRVDPPKRKVAAPKAAAPKKVQYRPEFAGN